MADEPKKMGGRLRTLIVLACILFVEAAMVIAAVAFLGGPADVEATTLEGMALVPENDRIVEQLVCQGRFPNSKRGVTYLYETEVYVQIKRKHQDAVKSHIEQFQNEIKADLTAIWRTSDPYHFDEPRLESLTRKVYALLSERFGIDQDSTDPVVSKCVIVMGTGMRVDS